MGSIPAHSGAKREIDQEIQDLLEERLKTRERDERNGEDWTPELKQRRIEQLKKPAPR